MRDDIAVYYRLCSADVRSQMQYRLSYLLFSGSTFVSLFLALGAAIGGGLLGSVVMLGRRSRRPSHARREEAR